MRDSVSGRQLALKKITRVFENGQEAKRVLREVRSLPLLLPLIPGKPLL